MKSIKDLIQPEEFETHILDAIPQEIQSFSKMHTVERQFINGLIRQIKPKHILELGVAEGAGACVILNAIKDDLNATVISVDIAENCAEHPDHAIGFCVNRMFPEGNEQHKLYTNKDISKICSEFKEKYFDFCVIDTAHAHPIESLKFLCVLPFLCQDAVVVFNDLCLFNTQKLSDFPDIFLANKLCFDTIVGDKIKPKNGIYILHNKGFSNIGAVQISSDTSKYIKNIFDMLYFPWATLSLFSLPLIIRPVSFIIKHFYEAEQYNDFLIAAKTNTSYHLTGKYSIFSVESAVDILARSNKADELFFYGAGKGCSILFNFVYAKMLKNPKEIWDRNKNKKNFKSVPVIYPPFLTEPDKTRSGVVIITIIDQTVANNVKTEILELFPLMEVYTYVEIYAAALNSELFYNKNQLL